MLGSQVKFYYKQDLCNGWDEVANRISEGPFPLRWAIDDRKLMITIWNSGRVHSA